MVLPRWVSMARTQRAGGLVDAPALNGTHPRREGVMGQAHQFPAEGGNQGVFGGFFRGPDI